MKKKTLRYVTMIGLIFLVACIPARTAKESMLFYNGKYYEPRPGVSVQHTPQGDALSIDISKYDIHGNTILIDPDSLEVVSYQDDSMNP